MRRRLARSAFAASMALAVAVAAPFTALIFVEDAVAPVAVSARPISVGPAGLLPQPQAEPEVLTLSSLHELFEQGNGGPVFLEPGTIQPPGTRDTRQPSIPELAPNFAIDGAGEAAEPIPTETPLPTVEPTRAPAPPRSEFVQSAQSNAAPAGPLIVRGRVENVSLTFYSCLGEGFCGNMSNGEKVYEGAVACSYDLAIGTRLRILGDPTGRVYVCKDRGLLTNTWIDVFFYDPADGWIWQAAVGRYGTIEIVSTE